MHHDGSLDGLGCSRREFVGVDMAAALFAFILDWVPAPRRGPWDSVAPIIPERRGTVEGVLKADSLDEALAQAKGCPVWRGGAQIAALEAFTLMSQLAASTA